MKRALFVSIVLVLSLSCWHSQDHDIDLSTPEKTLRSYYEGFKRSDFWFQKRTLPSWNESLAEERFDVVNPILQSYQILEIREAKDRKEDTFHLPEGDVDALVKEIYKDNKESLNSFVLRKFANGWLIIDWLTIEDADIHPDINVIDEREKRMLERKGKK
jgi:hypothetical protein